MGRSDALLEALDWDTRHFGRRVERTRSAEISEAALGDALAQARNRGTALVYHFRSPELPLGPAFLARHGGLRVCSQVRFAKPAEAGPEVTPPAGFRIGLLAGNETSDALRALSIAAGEVSRFRLDPRIPDERFEALYVRWIENSVAGELADGVLRVTDPEGREVGFLTVVHRPGHGELGIGALAESTRGRGLGRALFTAAEREVARAGLARCEIVTQGENEAACRLYDKLGYRVVRREDAYHFHLDEERALS